MQHRSVKGYNFNQNDKLFLDANIWLYMYAPQKPQAYWARIYSGVFRRILKARSQIFIDVLVLSEFVNRYSKAEMEHIAPGRKSKDFRNSQDFKPVAAAIGAAVKNILKHCSRIESSFSKLKTDDLITEYSAGDSDFNDLVIAGLCKSNGLTLITNDSDFRCQDISVLTANSHLLRKLANS